ncbi:hypothetical protein GH714_036679 [Hevea brasiliensis]|uniref:Glycosyltransferase n=1 Tax=Hevea brasiliensis TaxID=3981 RepID=A0A6A6L6X0_HEVBR|nr:hypothetical protein GH714_036679 [Hevea brasiliensis]
MEQGPILSPHILIFPGPGQGHVNSILKLAELLCLAGFKITFINFQDIHERLVRHTDVEARFSKYYGFQFKTIPGCQAEDPRPVDWVRKLLQEMEVKSKPIFKKMMHCISACSFWTFFSIPDVVAAHQLPIKEIRQCQALIINTFEELEGPILSQIRIRYPKIYTIGPLHEHLKTKLRSIEKQESYSSSNSLWEVDRTCITWLDNQPSQSVLYVSFGSITIMTREQLMEFWHGLVNSKKKFLWVIRPESVINQDGDNLGEIPEQLQEGEKEKGYIVKWAPQEEVLAHKAIGGFLTHSGWNSTLESMEAGVPMICWPYFGDQQVNSRFVSEVWKLGLDMKDVCDRGVVEKMVNDLMVDKREEFVKSTARMAELARKSVSEGGSSSSCLNRLIADIRLMNMKAYSSDTYKDNLS